MDTQRREFPNADPSLSYDLAKYQLSIQLDSVDALDNKLAVGMSLATALVALVLAVFGIRVGQEETVFSRGPIAMLSAQGALFLGTMVLLVLAFLTARWRTGLMPEAAWDQAEAYRDHTRELFWWATETIMKSFAENQERYQQKLSLARWGFAFEAVQALVGIVSIIVTLQR